MGRYEEKLRRFHPCPDVAEVMRSNRGIRPGGWPHHPPGPGAHVCEDDSARTLRYRLKGTDLGIISALNFLHHLGVAL